MVAYTGELPRKGNILGVGVSVTDYDEVVRHVVAAGKASQRLSVTATSVHGIIEAQDDPLFAAVLNHFHIVAPDGQPVRWGLGWSGQADLQERVYGPTLTLKVCEAAAREGLPIYLYGSTQDVLQTLERKLLARLPSLQVAGLRWGRFAPLNQQERDEDAKAIADSGARIVLVGMGCPRQDWWIFHMRDRIELPMLAVGAAFDFHAGLLPQAPPRLQGLGLEWAYRLTREPSRLWRRYLTVTPRFLPLMARQLANPTSCPLVTDLTGADARPCPG